MGGETTAYCLIAFLASNGALLRPEQVTVDAPERRDAAFLRSLVDDGLMPSESSRAWTRPVRTPEARAGLSVGGSYRRRRSHTPSASRCELSEHVGFIGSAIRADGPRAWRLDTPSSASRRSRSSLRVLERSRTKRSRVSRDRALPARRSAVGSRPPPSRSRPRSSRRGRAAHCSIAAQLHVGNLEAVLTGRIAPEAAARHAAGLIEAITGLPVVPARREQDDDYAAAATATLVADTTANVARVPAAAQTMPPARNIAGTPTNG